jgi:hypothetical protein
MQMSNVKNNRNISNDQFNAGKKENTMSHTVNE